MIKSVTQHSYFEKKPTIKSIDFKTIRQSNWVRPKSTHGVH